mmetsp:Transcript_107324/g.302026  ORF Transcript_107324/g.302026 Transcript_107324/m.302026 type:complete len:151 (-) Transcript_107324:196-648(-)
MPALWLCRSQLEKQGIPMNNLADWHNEALRAQKAKVTTSPVHIVPSPSRRKCAAHLWVEKPNADFGNVDFQIGERGWLTTETLDDWFRQFGRPIAKDRDVKKFAVALRPAPDSTTCFPSYQQRQCQAAERKRVYRLGSSHALSRRVSGPL